MNLFASSPVLRGLWAATAVTAAALFLTSCANSNTGPAPTPLAAVNVNGGTWTFTPQNSPNPAVISFTGTLNNQLGNGSSTSLQGGGSLQINGSCASDFAGPVTLTGAFTNPDHDNIAVQLSGKADGNNTLTIQGTMQGGNNNAIYGTYTIAGGPCATNSTAFTAIRDGTTGQPGPDPSSR